MSGNKSIQEQLVQLRQAGKRPTERLIQQILETGTVARPVLIELATNHQDLYDTEPVCWGPIHALRLLAEMPDVVMIAPLLNALPVQVRYEGDEAPEIWSAEVLDIIASCGRPAISLLWDWADATEHSLHSRNSAIYTLFFIATADPTTYDEIVDEARARLARSEDMDQITFLVYLLASLEVEEAYDQVMNAYRARKVHTETLSAARARQLILGDKLDATDMGPLSFWERYDAYGPYEAT